MSTAKTERTQTETRAILGFVAKAATGLAILFAAFLILFVISTAWMPNTEAGIQMFLE
jgi:uncharacterized membrane protein YtjA (UPF0391 family)